jgi:hypothetical protein
VFIVNWCCAAKLRNLEAVSSGMLRVTTSNDPRLELTGDVNGAGVGTKKPASFLRQNFSVATLSW